MSQSRNGQCWKLGLASALAISGVLAFYGDYALAQIRSDDTAVAGSSAVKLNPNNDRPSNEVNDRANCGVNLFRSFEHFSVSSNMLDLTNTQLSDTNKTPENLISTNSCILDKSCCPPDDPTCCCPG